jgi:hypothetical protein
VRFARIVASRARSFKRPNPNRRARSDLVLKRYTAEFIGTFALMFAGTGAIVINEISHGAITHVGIALTFGLVVLAQRWSPGNSPASGFISRDRFLAQHSVSSGAVASASQAVAPMGRRRRSPQFDWRWAAMASSLDFARDDILKPQKASDRVSHLPLAAVWNLLSIR